MLELNLVYANNPRFQNKYSKWLSYNKIIKQFESLFSLHINGQIYILLMPTNSKTIRVATATWLNSPEAPAIIKGISTGNII